MRDFTLVKTDTYALSLHELLCLKTFSKTFEIINPVELNKAITEWAEREIIAEKASDTLLILASLNLDPIPDRFEVEKYLLLYQQEQGIQNPSAEQSALVWLRVQLGQLIAASNACEIESKLAFFTHYFLDYPPRAFACISRSISNFYWELYDEAIPVFNSRASEMSEEALLIHVQERITPYYRLLNHPDWLWILAR